MRNKKYSEKQQLESVKQDPYNIQYIINPSDSTIKYLIDLGVGRNYGALRFVESFSNDLAIYAINKNPWNILYIKEPSEEVQLLAVNVNPDVIQHIANPTVATQLAAVQKKPLTISFIKNKCQEVKTIELFK